jgi:hypothetical protein
MARTFCYFATGIFSISPSGEERVHKLRVEGHYRLFTIKAARGSLIAEFLRELPNNDGEEIATFAFDSENGNPLREYFFPSEFGWGLACTDGEEFTFVMANRETNSLKLVTLAPATK